MTFKREFFACAKPITENYVVPEGTMCVQLIIPADDEHFALLQGLMAKLTLQENWQGDEAEAYNMAASWQMAYVLNEWLNCGE